ncbi:dihydrofolate reductase [Anaerobacillus sp. CMMVII]|uniref:dihydrofolate reductase family protein n=1 Tax=Anaerobacillus sp. CMMVII TaxID=2755588 RepID=UPI0021B710D1|nr:dihydrofolate reductase family protein [Anaerobacillus sp. CMMVII]MCT8136908.1 dihydrofolate reductase [Anaerobacillus sp. CMMVII]
MNKQRKLVVFIATSLDGYIATNEESLDWLFNVEGEGDNGYSEFFETVDTIIMGRRTYDWIMRYEKGDFPYRNKNCFVFSKAPKRETNPDVEFVNEEVGQFTDKLKRAVGKDIWIVGGGELMHSFLKEKLIDELIITIAPRLIGQGIPLFKAADYQLDLSLIGTRRFNQFVELHYKVQK